MREAFGYVYVGLLVVALAGATVMNLLRTWRQEANHRHHPLSRKLLAGTLEGPRR